MKKFRYFTIALGLLNMLGEFYRSVGDGRHIMFVLDDTFLGLALIVSALFFTKDTPPRRAFFAASWGAATGGVYGSFFSKLLAQDTINSGNLNPNFLTAFLGIFFVISIVGVICAICLPFKDETP